VIRWWPPIAVTAMVVLGLAVGKGATPIDDWFHQFGHSPVQYLLVLSNVSLLAVVMMAATAVAFDSRQGRLAATAALSPIVAWILVQICKPVFGRLKDDTLAYPSGHITLTVVVWGMVVLVTGAALWSVVTSIAVVVLAMLGQAVTLHYFTDTIGGLLLGTAVVCVGVLIAKPRLTGVNPMRSRSHAVA
jgi:membrane-associated phospholipid phosphatase